MSKTGDRIHVLHVDGEPNFVEADGTVLEREDDRFDVEVAANADEALDRLDDTVDCIVSDYDMPRTTGLELLDTVRERRPALPFILFTGEGSEEIASRAISAGVTDYLQKGGGTGQYAVLANRIENAVDRYRSRRDLEASQRRLSLFVEQSPLGVIDYNSEFEIVGLNPAGEEILGYSEAELRGETWEKLVAETSYEDVDEVTSALAEAEGGYHSIDENVRKDGEHIVCEWHNRVVTDDSVEHRSTGNRTKSGDSVEHGSTSSRSETDDSVEHRSTGNRTKSGDSVEHGSTGSRSETDDSEVVAIFSQFQEVTDRYERQQRIEALHESTRELMGASTREEVADCAVETARDVLGLTMNSVYLYDDEADALVPTATTDEALDLIGEPPVYEPGESLSWDAFQDGEVRVFEDVSTEPGRYNDDTAFGAEIVLPLGDHGVMYVAATEAGAFDDADVNLARTLAANTEEALSRLERERTLRESQRRYRTLIENFPDGAVFLFDEDLRYVLAGGTELSSVGVSPADSEGATPHDLFPDDVADELAANYRAALDGTSNTFERQYQGREYRIQTLPVRNDDGEVISGIAVSQNVTERKLRERELARQNERLDEFASVVSHDLRNPLNVAESHLQLAREGDPDNERLDAVASAHDRMNDLIDDLLTLAREGEDAGTLETVDLGDCVERCWRNVETTDARIDLRTDRTLRADPTRLQQLMENLMRNAVEHGSTNSQPPPDDGPGVPESDRELLFDAGYTAVDGGTGFGLTIVKRVVDAHGWEIRVTESETGGARFEITGVEFAGASSS